MVFKRSLLGIIVAGIAILMSTIFAIAARPASAQQIPQLDVERDPHGVDMLTGQITPQRPSVSIPAAPELTFQQISDFFPKLEGSLGTSGESESFAVSINAGSIASDSIACTQGGCQGAKQSGSVLSGGNGIGPFVYTQRGTGKRIVFDVRTNIQSDPTGGQEFDYLATTVINPGGPTLTFAYEYGEYRTAGLTIRKHRPTTVTSSSGYRLEFTYVSNMFDPSNPEWRRVARVRIVQISNPIVALAQLAYSHSGIETTAIDLAGRMFKCTYCSVALFESNTGTTSITLPGESVRSLEASTISNASSNITTLAKDGATYTYKFDLASSPSTIPIVELATISGPEGFLRVVDVENIPQSAGRCANASCGHLRPRQRIKSITNSLNETISYEFDDISRVTKVTYPEGNYESVTYDAGGNITSLVKTPKPGSGQAAITQTAKYNYTFECEQVTCYLPEWTRDGNGNQTDYTWAPHGGMLTRLDPTDASGQRRKIKYTYDSVGRPIKEEICAANSSGGELTCGSANSFVKQTTYFGATRLPASETITDGVGTAPLTTRYDYDPAGRLISTDGPLPGSDDATFARYDVVGRKIWEIGPRGEASTRPAIRTTFRAADDQVSKVETGTVPGTTTATSETPTLTITSQVSTSYNSRRLGTSSAISSSSGETQAITQMSYDGLNREQCVAIRMNAAAWSSLPSSACARGPTGSSGPDRISRKHYDTESRVTRIEQAVETSLVRNYATYEYSANGKQTAMIDARGYRAEMRYDGFDRQTHWYFPQPNQTGAINPSDFEQYTYDANDNRLTLRKRDGSVLSFTYDEMNRVTKKAVSERTGLDSTHTRDVFYTYDVRNLQTRAHFDHLGGEGQTIYYDRYGRVSSDDKFMDGVNRYLGRAYDAAGNRTALSYPLGETFYWTFTAGGQFNQVKDPSGTVVVDYNYNTRNELTDATRYSTAPGQMWTYDSIGRLASTGWAAGGAYAVNWSFTRNPANQITTETQTNDFYSWTGHINNSRSYVANGLNQYTSVAGQTYCHDKNGNLTLDGQYVYLYDIENRLVEMRAKVNTTCSSLAYTGLLKAKLRYDPLGRLHEIENFSGGVSQGPTRFLYDGDALVAEFDAAGNMLKRYVHGPAAGLDDPLFEYSGSGVSGPSRRNLYADARGSIVLTTGATGETPQVNTYDEWGVPGASNTGRFQYTGQVWLSELGMYYYKARIYSPLLGRFMQTDPIGYEDNVNLYGYVANDPVNGVDPTGKQTVMPPNWREDLKRGPQRSERGPSTDQGDGRQILGALKDFIDNYREMREDNRVGNDKEFHCRANCEASARGPLGEETARRMSNAREDTDDARKGANPEDRAADQAANRQGRDAGREARQSRSTPIQPREAERICRAACDSLAPRREDEER